MGTPFTLSKIMGSIKGMVKFPTPIHRTSGTNIILLAVGIFLLVIGAIVVIGANLPELIRSQYEKNLEEQFKAPEEAVKRQVRKVTIKRLNELGEEEWVEILANGEVRVYDKDGNLKKTGGQGFARTRNLFDSINRYLDDETQPLDGLDGVIEIIVETNKGTQIIVGGGGGGNTNPGNDLGQIIKDIIDYVDEALQPTPTPAPSPTPNPLGPTVTPWVTQAYVSPTPNLQATPGPGTPTPLPAYMTNPPFSCSDYDYLGRPVAISNVICGAD